MKQPHIRRSAYLLIATGIIHNLVGLGIGFSVLNDLLREGLFNTINVEHDRNAIFWFLFSGFAMMLWGALILEIKQIPKTFSWSLLVLSILGAFIMPASGFWLVIPQAIYMIWHQRSNLSPTQVQQAT